MTPEEKAKFYGVPLIPARPTSPCSPNHGVRAICGACGLELRGAMGYVCNKANCPTGLGGISSMCSSTLAQQVAGAQAEVATWPEGKLARIKLAGGDQP